MLKIFIIIGLVLIWFISGIIAFFIEVKQLKAIKFDHDAKQEFILALLFGIFSLFIILTPFTRLMDYLMKKVNDR